METYKIAIDPINKLGIDIDLKLSENLIKVEEIRRKLTHSIQYHNNLINLREEIATVPNEYMRCEINNINNTLHRTLLVRGCEKEMERIRDEINELKQQMSEIEWPVKNTDTDISFNTALAKLYYLLPIKFCKKDVEKIILKHFNASERAVDTYIDDLLMRNKIASRIGGYVKI